MTHNGEISVLYIIKVQGGGVRQILHVGLIVKLFIVHKQFLLNV